MKSYLSEFGLLNEDGKIKVNSGIKHVKIDIGLSHNNPHSREWIQSQPDTFVVGFEPNPDNLERIRRSMFIVAKNSFLIIIPCALSSTTGMMPFYCTGNDSGCSSLLEPVESLQTKVPVEKVINVPVFRLDEFFELWPWSEHPVIEYVKIDAQGSDLNIAKGAGKYLKNIAVITLEADCNYYKGADNSEENINAFMLENEFIRITEHKYPSFAVDSTYVNLKYQYMLPEIFYTQRS